MSQKGEYEEPKLDKYGQVIVPYSLYNVWTWKPRYRIMLSCFGGSMMIPVIVNYFQRRPIYSGLPVATAVVASGTALGYFLGYWYERRHKLRDQIMDHYMQLHPYDFEVTKRDFRKYKDILMPWEPVRAIERPIVWMDKKDWATNE